MSILERRLQLLLTEEQHARLAQEAARTGRSVNAVIREAIDRQHPDESTARSQALQRWLDRTEQSVDVDPMPSAAQLKAEYDQDEIDHMDTILRG